MWIVSRLLDSTHRACSGRFRADMRFADRLWNSAWSHDHRDRRALAAVETADAVVVVGVLVDRNIHGADARALVAVGAHGLAPLQAHEADTVKEGKNGAQGTDHPAKGPFGQGREGNHGDENGDLDPEQLVDHEPDLGIHRHPGQSADEGAHRAEFGKPRLESVIGDDKHQTRKNSVFDVGHPGGDPDLGGTEFVQDLLEITEGADRAAGHPADDHAEGHEQPYEVHGDCPDDHKVLKGADGTGEDGSGTRVTVQGGDTEPPGLALPKRSGRDKSLQVAVGDTDPEGRLNDPPKQNPVQGCEGLLNNSSRFKIQDSKVLPVRVCTGA